jgi:glutaminyl-tRNA synthetase
MSEPSTNSEDGIERPKSRDFIREIIDGHNQSGRFGGRVHTRFPPEPNGYLHVGHAKSICLNFGIAREYGGKCNLRYDDTNPITEDVEYVDSIERDVRWLGFEWDAKFYASDYFDKIYEYAERLIEKGLAYVCDLSAEETSRLRGSLTEPGKDSPYRNRSVEENLDLFRRMRKGEFPDGARALRARIDMASPNLLLRDPVLYRIRHAHHHRTGDRWCIYPTYDFAHGYSDSLEVITHSICTLEFVNHRPLYDWLIERLDLFHPQQIEFARLNFTYTILSKRKLIDLVAGGHVRGWDDPRMPTIAGIRRRGYTPSSIRAMCERIGVTKVNSVIDLSVLEESLREELNARAERKLAVLRPLKLIIENYPADQVEEFELPVNPEDEAAGNRKVPFCRELWIERDDFLEDPPKNFFRLGPGREVRLRGAYWVRCESFRLDMVSGEIKEITCSYDPATRGGQAPLDGRKVKGTIHWVSARHAIDAEVRLYDRMFATESPAEIAASDDFTTHLDPASLEIVTNAKLEPSLATATPEARYQFERLGYFCLDTDSRPEALVFNRTVTLKDSWAKEVKKAKGGTA